MSELARKTEWTPGSLRLLRRNSRRGYTLHSLAIRMAAPASEIDIALWALVGRTPAAAAIYLNRRRTA